MTDALVASLIGLAAWFAGLGVHGGRSAGARTRAGIRGAGRTSGPSLPPWGPWAGAGAVVGAALWGPTGAAFGAVGGAGLRATLDRRRRRAAVGALDEQLADAVGAIGAGVRAGLSLPQALAYAEQESRDPLRATLSALVADVQVGVPLGDAVAAWGAVVGTDDARLVAAALELHRRAGGDLPTMLEQVGATIRERVEAAQEVRALTAQARLSGTILGCLPIGFFAFLWVTSRADMAATLATPAGAAAVVLGLVLELAAFLWIRSLLAVDR